MTVENATRLGRAGHLGREAELSRWRRKGPSHRYPAADSSPLRNPRVTHAD